MVFIKILKLINNHADQATAILQESYMLTFSIFTEQTDQADSGKLKHIDHAEDRIIFSGKDGFKQAYSALLQAHNHIKNQRNNSNLTMKYDGSPSIVFGYNPSNGKFFVASKSAFNKTPKLNYTNADIETNHGHAPGLVAKLVDALKYLPKVCPNQGVFQGDLMFSGNDVISKPNKAIFTPNTITYTAVGAEAVRVKRAKLGLVVHQKYVGNDLTAAKAVPITSINDFNKNNNVWIRTAEHNTSQIVYSAKQQKEFLNHLAAAKQIHDAHGAAAYNAITPHGGHSGRLAVYINDTVRKNTVPRATFFRKNLEVHHNKLIDKVTTDKSKTAKRAVATAEYNHVAKNANDYDNLFKIHTHLQQAKDVLVKVLEQYEGGLQHSINGKPTGPEGFVLNHAGSLIKLVNRTEFSRANLLKART